MSESEKTKEGKNILRRHHYGKSVLRFAVVAILIAVQISIMVFIAWLLKNNAIYCYLIIEVISVITLFPLLSDTRNAAYKIYWISVILTLPLVGHIMYILWGRDKANKREHKKIQMAIDDMNKHQIMNEQILDDLCSIDKSNGKIARYLFNQQYPVYKNTKIKYFDIGEKAFYDMEQELNRAKKNIFISFFTIADGVILDRLVRILERKIKQNVEVKVMYDDAGSVMQLSDDEVEKLIRIGAEVIRFNPVEKNYHRLFLNYRTHQKIVIIDGVVGYTGGINASDCYANIVSPYGHWKDIAVKLTGEAVYSMTLIFLGMWNASGKNDDFSKYFPDKQKLQELECSCETYCIPFADGPSNNPENEALDMFKLIVSEAHKEVTIMTPYLILDDTMRDALCLAAKSGIDVKMITPGIGDKVFTKYLTEWNYGELLKSGVKIYEYKPGFIHAKMCSNESSVLVGTINMDFRSFFLHYENAVWIANSTALIEIKEDFEKTLSKSRQITYEEFRKRPVWKRFIQTILQMFKSQF